MQARGCEARASGAAAISADRAVTAAWPTAAGAEKQASAMAGVSAELSRTAALLANPAQRGGERVLPRVLGGDAARPAVGDPIHPG
jgi:hypothetical protein